ncbi:hypothetical protein TBK1r_58750 [Stieleria magnilauensis]|uniref:Transmembrane protein n=2 Tax=Stieleria magnilauensis TaxID=2527963 RepID=A0ABX5XXV3_9BACT|nr:hypothetical protein TBK1r_58750 [Planctomycetes bacterium TBK1r]
MQIEASCYLAIVALASVLERPFVTCSGVEKHALRTSVFSNVIASPTWLVFGSFIELSMSLNSFRMHGNLLAVLLFAFAFQVAAKVLVVRVSARKPINVGCVFAGNGFGLVLIWALYVSLVSFNDQHPHVWVKMVRYVPLFSMLSYAVFFGIAVLIAIESLSAFVGRRRIPDDSDESSRESDQ